MSDTLVIIPCGAAKAWDGPPLLWTELGADLAYTGTFFKVNRAYAEHFADRWLILSARHGLLEPTDLISDYDVSFNGPQAETVTSEAIRAQILKKDLHKFGRVIVLGGVLYRKVLSEAFSTLGINPSFPFAGLEIGYQMQAIKRAINDNHPLPQCVEKTEAAHMADKGAGARPAPDNNRS